MRTTSISLSLALVALVGCSPSPSPKPAAAPQAEAPDDGSPMKLVAQAAEGIGDPEIEISNTAEQPLTIEISGPTNLKVDVPGSEARSIKIPAGNYVFRMIAGDVPNDQPFTFGRDMRYRFTVRLILEIDDPRFVGKGFECFEVKQKPFYSVCTRRLETCKISRTHVPPQVPTGECAHRAEMISMRAKSKEGKPMGFFTPTAAECETVRTVFLDRKIGTDASTCELVK